MIKKTKLIQQMKIGLIMTTHNRIDYLRKTIESIKNSVFPECCHLLIYDDGSNQETKDYIHSIKLNIDTTKIYGNINHGVEHGLKVGLNYFKQFNYDLYCIIDSDVLFNKYWLVRILELYKRSAKCEYIYSGFNANNSNRHKAVYEGRDFYIKNTIGGLNMFFDNSNCDSVMDSLNHKGRWDWQLCKEYGKLNKVFIITKPSVLQHIGIDSSINHLAADVATDFV
jgi:glycosyltransferase involved in cell wall biosynthesis